MIDTEVLKTIYDAVILGKTFEDAGFPDEQEYHDAWDVAVSEVAAIEKEGGIVEFPFDMPDLDAAVV